MHGHLAQLALPANDTESQCCRLVHPKGTLVSVSNERYIRFFPLHKNSNVSLCVSGTCNISNNDSMHKELPVLLAKGLDLELGRQQTAFGTWTLAAKNQVAASLARTSRQWCSSHSQKVDTAEWCLVGASDAADSSDALACGVHTSRSDLKPQVLGKPHRKSALGPALSAHW